MFLQRFLCTLFFLCIFSSQVIAAEATFSWLPNTESTLAGYKIHYGPASRNYTNVIDVGLLEPDGERVEATVSDLTEGETYYFAATAYDTSDLESDYSDEVIHTVPVDTIPTPPLALNSSVTGNEDATISGVLGVDNTNGLSLQYTIESEPASGGVTVDSASGQFIYTPVADFNGQDMFSFTVSNTYGVSNTATVSLVVNAVNDAPVAQTVSIATTEDSAVSGQLIAQDKDGDTLSFSLSTQPSNGSALVNQNGSFTYTPSAGWNGTDAFTFTVNDGTVASSAATVTVSVQPADDTIVTEATFSWLPNTETSLAGYKIHYGTISGSYDSVIDVGNPPVQADGYVYGQVGNLVDDTTYYFAATAYDTAGNESGYSTEVIWKAGNELTPNPPLAIDSTVTGNEDATISGVLGVDNTNGLSLQYTIESAPASGGVTVDSASGQFIYTPVADFNGQDMFSFTVSNTYGVSNTATVSLVVNAVNDAPVAQTVSIATTEDSAVSGQLIAQDKDGDTLSFSLSTQPSNGSALINQDGSFTYTPSAGWNGTDAFTFTANDGTVTSSAATVTIAVQSVNDAPVAQATSFATSEDNSVSGQLTANDSDGDTLSYALVGQAGKGSVIVYPNGTFTYTPSENWYGTDSFSFSAFDGTVTSNTATVAITVASVNDVPVADGQSLSVDAGTTTSGQLTGADVDGDSLTFTLTSTPAQGTILMQADGAFSYTPEEDAEGSDSFTFTVNDGTSNSLPATVAVAINEEDPSIRFELSEIQTTSDWQFVSFADSFTEPVAIAKTASFNDSETGVVRVRNISGGGLEVRYQEWDYLDGVHSEEMTTLMVMEAGSFTLENGAMVEAACFQASGRTEFTSVSFQNAMSKAPVVLASVNSVNETDAVTVRVQNATENGFEYMLQEQEANEATHAEETVCYIAWEPSTGSIDSMLFEVATTGDTITNDEFTFTYSSRFIEQPFILAGQQSANGGDTAVLSVQGNTADALIVSVSEEQSSDSEIDHIAENGGYIAIAFNDPAGDPDGDGLTSEAEDTIYNTHPGIADTDQDGIADGAEVNLWLELGSSWNSDIDQDGLVNILDADADGDGMNDGEEIASGYDPSDPYDQESSVEEASLSTYSYKIKQFRYVELTWSGAASTSVDIYRNGTLLETAANNGTYTDGPFRSKDSIVYQVCEAGGTSSCSNEESVSW